MKKVIIILAVISITGCGNWVNEASALNAIELCKTNGGLKHLSIFNKDDAVCNNGAVFSRNQWMVKP